MDDMRSTIDYINRRRDFYENEKIMTQDPVLRSYFAGKVEALKETVRILKGDM